MKMPLHPMQPRQKALARHVRGYNYQRSMTNNNNTPDPKSYRFDRFDPQEFDWSIKSGWPIGPNQVQASSMNGILMPHRHNVDGNSAYNCCNTIPVSHTNVKIDIHCGNQTNPMNVNSSNATNHVDYHDTGAIGGQQLLNENCCEGDLRGPYSGISFMPAQSVPSTSDCDSMEDYDTADVPTARLSPVENNNFTELLQMALHGCEIAEEMAIDHQNRPCFKKIDSLCARMKQDLVRPDSVLANINSQGIVWAVKDFIFVFTRIVNAWNIIKGYVYKTPEGLNNVKSALSLDFHNSFAKWETSTLDFCNNLIESFENINEMVQTQRVAMQKLNTNISGKPGRNRSANNSSANKHVRSSRCALDEAVQLLSANSLCEKDCENCSVNGSQCNGEQSPVSRPNYYLNVVKNSEETQRQAVAKGTYMKTGLYNPLKKEVYQEMPMTSLAVAPPNPCAPKPTGELKTIYTQTTAPICFNPLSETSEIFNNCWLQKHDQGDPFVSPDAFNIGFEKEKFNKHAPPPPIARPLSITTAAPRIEYLLYRLCNLNEAEYFFSSQFTKNYFPDFQTNVNYSDLRTIMLKLQAGGYASFAEIETDLRNIVYCAKHYLQTHPNALLRSSTAAFEKELEVILRDH